MLHKDIRPVTADGEIEEFSWPAICIGHNPSNKFVVVCMWKNYEELV